MRKNWSRKMCAYLLGPIFLFPIFSYATGQEGRSVIGPTENMSIDELIKFYSENPDYGKKRLQIDYEKYKSGDWFVVRGEYGSMSGTTRVPEASVPVSFYFGTQRYITVTNSEGVFNLEVPKAEIRDMGYYLISVQLDRYKIALSNMQLDGKTIKDMSVASIRLTKEPDNESPGGYRISMESLHNPIFAAPIPEQPQRSVPSIFGIQGIPLIFFLFILLAFASMRWLRFKRKRETMEELEIRQRVRN